MQGRTHATAIVTADELSGRTRSLPRTAVGRCASRAQRLARNDARRRTIDGSAQPRRKPRGKPAVPGLGRFVASRKVIAEAASLLFNGRSLSIGRRINIPIGANLTPKPAQVASRSIDRK